MRRKTFIPFGQTNDHSIDYLLGILEDARITTLERVEQLTPEELHWQYAAGCNTIGVLLSHMIACEHYHRIALIGGREFTPEEQELYLPGLEMGKYIPQLITDWSIEKYLQELADARAQLLASIEPLTANEFHQKHEGYNKNTGYNLAWTFYHLAEDEVHHRGQISILRKLFKDRKK